MRIRWLVAGLAVAALVAVVVVLRLRADPSDSTHDDVVVALPTRAPATRGPAERTWEAEFLTSLTGVLTAEARNPSADLADITVHSYAETDAILGWRMLRSPDDHSPDLRITGRTPGVFDVVEYG